jgi:hypothetical protein
MPVSLDLRHFKLLKVLPTVAHEDDLAQLDLGIADLERRVSETASRVSLQPGAFGSIKVLHFMEQTLEQLRQRRHLVWKQLNLVTPMAR